jgi:polyhydroxyalkanoate synthase
VDSALQHERAPRPLPLFLELVRELSADEPELAQQALAGLRAYERAPRIERPPPMPEIARRGGACLRDHGGSGPAVVLIPSLINPPRILDLDEQVSLAAAIARMGRRTLLLDWGPAAVRRELDVAGHIEDLLLPLLDDVGEPPALVGYCLGGTMAIAAANLASTERVVTLAAPWHFAGYPVASKAALNAMWSHARAAAERFGALPMEVLQAAFWSLDPKRTVRKFVQFGRMEPASAEARRFVELEDWSNEGEPLPFPAARELIEDLFGADGPGTGAWRIGGRPMTDALSVPLLNIIAVNDRISPPDAAPGGEHAPLGAGHVGMIVGSVRERLHEAIAAFLHD